MTAYNMVKKYIWVTGRFLLVLTGSLLCSWQLQSPWLLRGNIHSSAMNLQVVHVKPSAAAPSSHQVTRTATRSRTTGWIKQVQSPKVVRMTYGTYHLKVLLSEKTSSNSECLVKHMTVRAVKDGILLHSHRNKMNVQSKMMKGKRS